MIDLREEVQAALRDLEARALQLYGQRMRGLVLFGSHARGDAGPDSDLDVAIVLDGEWQRAEEMLRWGAARRSIEEATGVLLDLAFLRPAEWEGQTAGAEPEIYSTIREEGRFIARA